MFKGLLFHFAKSLFSLRLLFHMLSRHQRLSFLMSPGCYTNETMEALSSPLDRTTREVPGLPPPIAPPSQKTSCHPIPFLMAVRVTASESLMGTENRNDSGSFEVRDLDSCSQLCPVWKVKMPEIF